MEALPSIFSCVDSENFKGFFLKVIPVLKKILILKKLKIQNKTLRIKYKTS